MVCRKQRRYFKLEISSLWEVHLDTVLWKRIVLLANRHNSSFTWITRYCVFRLARKKNLYMRNAMKIHSNKIKSLQKNVPLHRHLICLYGDDEKLLRMAAIQLGITVSHMIRIALHWFLPKLENKTAKWEHLYYHGTKICRHFSLKRTNTFKIPFMDHITYEKWSFNDWWNRPEITIRIPYHDDES